MPCRSLRTRQARWKIGTPPRFGEGPGEGLTAKEGPGERLTTDRASVVRNPFHLLAPPARPGGDS
jgi:hypothetical protein